MPARSVAVALNVVDESSATLTVRPGEVKSAAEPLTAGVPVQPELVYSLTVENDSAEPLSSGLLSFAGDAGDEAETDGVAGAVESSV